jgi:hypothetical protein
LRISKENFERPEKLTIKIDCFSVTREVEEEGDDNDSEKEIKTPKPSDEIDF